MAASTNKVGQQPGVGRLKNMEQLYSLEIRISIFLPNIPDRNVPAFQPILSRLSPGWREQKKLRFS